MAGRDRGDEAAEGREPGGGGDAGGQHDGQQPFHGRPNGGVLPASAKHR